MEPNNDDKLYNWMKTKRDGCDKRVRIDVENKGHYFVCATRGGRTCSFSRCTGERQD